MSRETTTEVQLPKIAVGETVGPVGQSVIREDAIPKVTGRAVYAADVHRPGMLYGKALLSTQPHALIKRIDTRKAERMPGVRAVLTARDIPGENRYGLAVLDQQALAGEKVRFVGEPVALVAAETPYQAEEAVRSIHVEYEPLPAVFDPVEALKPDAPRVHENGNLLLHTRVRKGDIVKGFAEADIVVENVYQTSGQDHAPIEPENGIAWFEEDGTLSIISPTQCVFRARRQVALVLNMPMNRIRIANLTMGGGFGRKDDIMVEMLVSLLARATGRPVRLTYSRHETMLTQTHRHPTKMRIRTGATRDGKLTALEAVAYGDTGAYASLGIYVIKRTALHFGGPYYYPSYKADSLSAYTNNPISGAMRGFGVVQAAVAHESQMDEMARKLGVDPLDFRLKNCLRPGLTTGTGQMMTEGCGIEATLLRLRDYMAEHELHFYAGSEVAP